MRCIKGSLCLPCFVLAVLAISFIQTQALAQTGPCLNVWPDTISFHRDICSDPDNWQGLDTQMVAIYNGCEGDLQWSITPSEPWIFTEPSTGGNFDSVMVFIDPQFQPEPMPAPGDSLLISAYLTVEAPGAENSPAYVGINYWITCQDTTTLPDSLVAFPSFFNFAASPNQAFEDLLNVYEVNGNTIMFELSNNSSWLTLPLPFTPWTTPATIPFGVQTGGLSVGTYFDTIVVTPVEDPEIPTVYVPVVLNVHEGNEYNIVAEPSSFNLTVSQGGSIPGLGTLVYEQSGAALYFWVETRSDSSWINIHYPNEEYPGWVTPDSVIFDVLAQNLAPGIYADTIVIFNPLDDSSWYDEILIPVVLSVTGSSTGLATDPSSFNFILNAGDSVIGEGLYVYDLGGGAVDFWTYNYSSWLYVDTMAASPLTTPETITLDVRTDGLPLGTFVDTVFIMSYDYQTEAVPVWLQVYYDTATAYVVNTDPASFSFTVEAGGTLVDTLQVYEASGANLPFGFSYGASWLNIDYINPMPPFVTPMALGVSVDATALSPGNYTTTITIFPDSIYSEYYFDPVYVPVSLYVEGSASGLASSPDHYEFTVDQGAGIDNVALFVYYEGGSSMPFGALVSPGAGWLQLEDSSNTTYFTPDTIYFDVASDDLYPGMYTGEIVLFELYQDSAKSSDVHVPVTLIVQGDQPDYVVETYPTAFDFSLEPGESHFDTLLVYETHGYVTPFAFWSFSPWLVVEPFGMPPYMTPSTLGVVVMTDTLPAGQYYDSIVIYPAYEPEVFTPFAVPVVLTVGNPYSCGDADGSGGIDIDDVVYLINYIFQYGDAPRTAAKGDVDCNGATDIDDVVFLIQHIFLGGPEPCSGCVKTTGIGL